MILATDTIVILKTEDSFYGKVEVPAIVKYWDEENEAYEMNVYFPTYGRGAVQKHIGWWVVSPDEIDRVIGTARVENEEKCKEAYRLIS